MLKVQHPPRRRDDEVKDLPASPDDIDLDRVVHEPAYREAVKDLLRRWGVGESRH